MMQNRLTTMGPNQRKGRAEGIYSVCSSHPQVLLAAFSQAAADNSDLLIEATCNQVNQFGGYSGMTPADFIRYLSAMADQMRFDKRRLITGGDHLGPHVWKNEPADSAMDKAETLVGHCVSAGYAKIHLDASMALGDDPDGPLAPETSAVRAARLCRAAESAAEKLPAGASQPVYVVGAEVPMPGGSMAEPADVPVTDPGELARYLDVCQKEFWRLGLEDAWLRVIAVVVQPGVNFGGLWVAPYQRPPAAALSAFHDQLPNAMGYEIHATDFQHPDALMQMVHDHFCLLKVGPALTFALREVLFGLACIEQEWFGNRKDIALSRLREVLCDEMAQFPMHWSGHHPGSGPVPDWQVLFSYLDRVRYYWRHERLQKAVQRLETNLGSAIPIPLIRQYMPDLSPAVTDKTVAPAPRDLADYKVRNALKPYAGACRMDQNPK
ncbi:MAG: class II D-tagatose-bisphosphate aldolase, non-catalytic subunit [Desulfobacterales bacterium]|nr:class II D-tagatose-bisphosphate aldolase, non-catalytic subunit [Desulfobacterales bacterium]